MQANATQDFKTLPETMKHLPIGPNGFIVPWFVAWIDGKPEFRVADTKKRARAINERLCWVCGGKLGAYLSFVIGPMCGITRTTSEPACHRLCAAWSLKNCPFLTRPHMVRREGNYEGGIEPVPAAGEGIMRNPGVALLWITRTFTMFSDGRGGRLISVGDPLEVEFYAEGRLATRAEVVASIESGVPLLLKGMVYSPQGIAALQRSKAEFERLLPA